MDRPNGWLNPFSLGAFIAALGVLLGAFGAHALATVPPKNLAGWQTGTQYLFVGAFGMMLDGLFQRPRFAFRGPAVALLVGVLFFSASLYALALGAPRWLGMITPLGGVSLVAGFVWIGARAWRIR